MTFPRPIRCAGEVSQARDDAPVSAIMVSMSDDYKGLLRRVIGEPTVSSALWGIVTSVSEGDEDAYADALVAIGREFGYYCLEPVIEDWLTPGVVLDAILGGWPTVQSIWQMIARHPNVTADMERYCRQKRNVTLNECLAASPGVSGETMKRLLRSKSARVVETLLGNAALSGDVLRSAERRARGIGMRTRDISWAGGRNASMPADVLESWLSSSDEGVRLNALVNPVAPTAALWEHLTQKTAFDSYSYPGIDIFPSWSNADGDMIDWFLSRWEKQVGGALRSNFPQRIECQWTAEAALLHPRAHAVTLERMYARYGGVNMRMCMTAARAPSSPDWVRRDAIRRTVDAGYSASVSVDSVSASPEHARLLYECGCLAAAADCENAPGDLLVEILEAKLRAAAEEKSGNSDYAFFRARDALKNMLSHDNMPVSVRREYAWWSPVSMWLVARDGFLGRA